MSRLTGDKWLVAMLLYGGGLRLLEALRLRVKDLDFVRGEITVREGKGDKDRVTTLPRAVVHSSQEHLLRLRRRPDWQRGEPPDDQTESRDQAAATTRSRLERRAQGQLLNSINRSAVTVATAALPQAHRSPAIHAVRCVPPLK